MANWHSDNGADSGLDCSGVRVITRGSQLCRDLRGYTVEVNELAFVG